MTHAPTPVAPDRDAVPTLTYEGTDIRQRGHMLNLTDMWRAAGSSANRRPTFWLDMEATKRFRAHVRRRWSHPDLGPAGVAHTAPRAFHPKGGRPDLTAEAAETASPNVTLGYIWTVDGDGLVATARGNGGGTWAHWQLALAYAKYLSPEFHTWCNDVVRNAMQRFGGPPDRRDALTRYVDRQFGRLHRRLDTLDRHAADTMFLVVSAQDLLLNQRRPFSEPSRAVMCAVIANPPYEGQCPSCETVPVLTTDLQVGEGAQFDHFYHRGLNRPEHGWLVCKPCHHELTHGGYLARFTRMPEFRRFQDAVRDAVRAGKAQRLPGAAAPWSAQP